MKFNDTYGHTPIQKAFEQGDVYGIGFDQARAARRLLRLGMIGAGGVAQSKYFPAVARLRMIWEPVEIVAFSEPRDDQACKVEHVYGGRRYRDHLAMLENEMLDGVLVLSPDTLHHQHVLDCLNAGCHVLVEKPIARSLAHAAEMCRAADQLGLILMTVANKRFSPPYRRAHALIQNCALKTPALFSGKFNLGYDYVDLFESGTIHLFDLALYLMGAVAAVSAAGSKQYAANKSNYPIDNAAVTLQFVNGGVGNIITSASALSLKPWERVEVYGNHAWLAVEDQNELTFYDSESGGAQSWKPAVPNTLLFDEEFGGYMGIIENFVQAVRGAETPVISGWDGYRAYELLTAIQLSIARHEWVQLPLTDFEAADREVARWLGREAVQTDS